MRYCSADSWILCSAKAALAAARCASTERRITLIQRAATSAVNEGCRDSAVTSAARASSVGSLSVAAAAAY